MRACGEHGAPIAVQGGNTGMVGGAVPRAGEIVLSLVRLGDLAPVDMLAQQVECGAGVTLERLQDHVRREGLDFPVDFAARGSATIGGVIATNAGGSLAARYGMTRAWVAGLEAVLADGSTMRRLRGLLKDNAGYDLTGLLVGSEGTLGVVTRARLRLTPLLPVRAVGLFAFASIEDAFALLHALRRRAPSFQAADYLHREGMELVCAHRGFAQPFREGHDTYVVVECAGHDDPTDELGEAAALADEEIVDSAIATDADGRRCALGLPRVAQRGALQPGRAAQDGRHGAARRRPLVRARRARGGGRWMARRGGVPLRPPGRRQRPRERARPAARRRTRSTTSCSISSRATAARSAPSTAWGWRRAAGCR